MAAALAKQFQQAVEKGENSHKLRAILDLAPKEDLMAWTDDSGLDLLHHCILQNNAEAADLLLKQGYFARPHEPKLSLYLHLAAALGLRSLISVLVQERPDDFRVAKQPLLIPDAALASGAAPSSQPPPPASTSSAGSSSSPSARTARSSAAARPASSRNRANPSDANRKASTPRSPTKDYVASRGFRGSDGYSSSGSSSSTSAVAQTSKKRLSQAGLIVDGSEPLMRNPLNVAARARQLECVRLLLDVCVLKAHPDAPCKGYLTLAALADDPVAMKLLLQNQNSKSNKHTPDDYKAAVEVCVKSARPECLDLLLGNQPGNVDIRHLFKQINFFHVLYTFSASYGKGVYGRLPEVTRVLIARGHDVNCDMPPRTYPLYTLLTHSFCFHDYSFTQYYVQCLRLLLKAGANPNFDEVDYERRLLQQKGVKFAAGRNAYASALHCLLETVETFASQLSSKALAVSFVEDCTEVLMGHRANIAKVGRVGDARSCIQGNVLHQYAKSSVTIGVDKAILQTIFRYGADPDVKVNGKYAINIYFDQLFELLSLCEVVDTRHKYEADVKAMMSLMCQYMTSPHIKEAAFVFKRSHGRSLSEQVKHYVDPVLADFERRSKRVRPLQGLAAWRVWQLCGRKAEHVHLLPVKVELKTLILPFF